MLVFLTYFQDRQLHKRQKAKRLNQNEHFSFFPFPSFMSSALQSVLEIIGKQVRKGVNVKRRLGEKAEGKLVWI